MEAFREYMIGIKGPLTTPIGGGIRSLNLGNSAAIILYEALRQHGFDHMQAEGRLRNYQWK